jgi:hypothetical protein
MNLEEYIITPRTSKSLTVNGVDTSHLEGTATLPELLLSAGLYLLDANSEPGADISNRSSRKRWGPLGHPSIASESAGKVCNLHLAADHEW